MRETFLKLKSLLAGKWEGEGFAQYPTIDNTSYTEKIECIPDENKDAIRYDQKTLYKNSSEKNGQTVFWDTGFILLSDEKILLVSSQVGGRQETYELTSGESERFTFDSRHIENDVKNTIRSQRVFSFQNGTMEYELNMASKDQPFQNHLRATLERLA